ncbi:hypothetical protein G1H10_13600 [Phytoactinopolyspora halotolerans]|uniref:Uncharacterized protein n=1 Tax=Phytoactinopolyspora halotolerans TaxID=1981512 RepID=A0A6L9S862_9ACTN|nr:hypothetical protein [Phytoactinopolyspora halotolerans]NEE01203.1 hypothetical protein [Phytoactinopolyspora halotolerans]
MIEYREASSVDSAARTATVLQAPTSPAMTPIKRSVTHQPVRAMASLCPAWRCSIAGT